MGTILYIDTADTLESYLNSYSGTGETEAMLQKYFWLSFVSFQATLAVQFGLFITTKVHALLFTIVLLFTKLSLLVVIMWQTGTGRSGAGCTLDHSTKNNL